MNVFTKNRPLRHIRNIIQFDKRDKNIGWRGEGTATPENYSGAIGHEVKKQYSGAVGYGRGVLTMDNKEAAMRLKYYALHDANSVYIIEAIHTAINALQNEKVERGQWMAFKDEQGYIGDLMRCSSCNFVFDNYSGIFNYCPSCGKDMRVGEANEHR